VLSLIASLAIVQSVQDPALRVKQLGEALGVEIEVLTNQVHFDRRGYTVDAEAVPPATLAKYVDLFESQWKKYPKSIFGKVHLKKVVVGSQVKVLGQPRAAVPEFAEGWFWLDAAVGSAKPDYGRKVLHHDFFHMIDEWDSKDGRTDKAWEALNRPEAKYGKGGWYAQKGNVGALRTDLPGFVTEYAISAVEEDKAEVFSHLIVSWKFMNERVEKDEVIAKKVAKLKADLVAFEPLMDDKWFESFR